MNILDTIGNTPLIKAQHIIDNPNVDLYLKLEGHNPAGSVKDRAALNMIKSAMDRGDIKSNTKIVEATSGNTGIALAMIAGFYNITIELVMPENATPERIKTMKAYGAIVTLTSKSKGIEGSRDYAENLSKKKGYLILNQFANDDNWKAHYKTTGPEIWRDSEGKISHFISSMGTTGTIMGTSTYLKEQNTKIKIVGVQPTENSNIPGIRKWSKSYLPKIFDSRKVDQIINVSENEAIKMAQQLALKEGVFAGMSSGGAVAAALKLAENLENGVLVVIICDRGDRYLSSNLFN
ncbi:MAG: cysteine synthase CysM [Flavobacteriaceae bacterium]|nr:cysteine synthase CysM [Bacteroidia bacterium]NNK83699.1 cysteine synthase CysM [Flavobacteriaceae bacterium]